MGYPLKNKKEISSFRNALQLLRLFSMEEAEFTLSEFADKLDIGISTAYRLTTSLQLEGFLIRDPITKKFRLGTSIIGLGHTVSSQVDFCKPSIPILERLVKETGETAHLAIMKNNQVLYLHKVDSDHPVHLLSHMGKHNPLHATSTGQVILAFQPEHTINSIISKGLERFTEKTITSEEELNKKLILIRKQKYSVSKEELHDGVSSVAAPIIRMNGEVFASVSLAGPTSRFNDQKIPLLIKKIKLAAEDISKHSLFTSKTVE